MEYKIYINKGLDNEATLPETFYDEAEAIKLVDATKESVVEAKTVCTGFYDESGRYVKMYYRGPIELL